MLLAGRYEQSTANCAPSLARFLKN